MRIATALVLLSSALLAHAGCSEEAPPATASAKASAVTATAPKPTSSASSAPAPTASAAPRSDCPKGSSGPGTLTQPCEGKGNSRMMDAKWTGKTDDKGPAFSIANKAPASVLYGKIAVYFYDAAGKQLQTKEAGKDAPRKICFGKIFGEAMKVAEKATITFSCVKKEDVPEGTTAIEAEMLSVGFADASGKAVEFYWSNPDLAPNDRAKGGVK